MSMTDRELLELAAKAVGINGEYREWNSCTEPLFTATGIQPRKTLNLWNPLVDDKDAFRLAVKLDIDIYQADNDGPSVYAGYWHKRERRDVNRLFCIESTMQDPYVATRRAIVRAAAEIGKQMEEV